MMEYDIHTILDLLTLLATLWVIYIVRFQLYESYQPEQDSIHDIYVVSLTIGSLPCACIPATLSVLLHLHVPAVMRLNGSSPPAL